MASTIDNLRKKYHNPLVEKKAEGKKSTNEVSGLSTRQKAGLVLGPSLFIMFLFIFTPTGMPYEARAVLASTLWIATWWITEPIPIPATSLFPIILFPLTGALDSKTVTSTYGNNTIYLFMGGFMIALAMEKWGLHKRIALFILTMVGTSTNRIILGFMVATGFLSMWISNTASAMMMVPIGMAIVMQVSAMFNDETAKNESGDSLDAVNFRKSILLGIAYSASIGGLGTLIGTPPNIIFAGVVKEIYGIDISFAKWMLFGIPISLIMLMVTWYFLVKIAFPMKMKKIPSGQDIINTEKKNLGKMGFEEKIILVIFFLAAISWISRPLINKFIPGINDTTIALIAGLILFMIPSLSKKGQQILNWDTVKELPWGILLLFGGGLAIAKGFMDTGLANWIINQLTFLDGVNFVLILIVLAIIVKFLTEITSNTATATMLFPIMASLALAIGVHPFSLMIVAGLTASMAFMMPVGTPPNAIVFATNHLKIGDMVKAGILINIISIVIVILAVYYLLPFIWGIDLQVYPDIFIK